jgi:hypothetical protein
VHCLNDTLGQKHVEICQPSNRGDTDLGDVEVNQPFGFAASSELLCLDHGGD